MARSKHPPPVSSIRLAAERPITSLTWRSRRTRKSSAPLNFGVRSHLMTVFLRALSLISAFLMVLFLFMPIMALRHGTAPIRDTIASTVFVVLAVLAMRCTKWLWRKKRFWNEVTSFSEVAAFGCLVLLWPLVAFLEQQTIGITKAIIQIAMLLVALSVYMFIRLRGQK